MWFLARRAWCKLTCLTLIFTLLLAISKLHHSTPISAYGAQFSNVSVAKNCELEDTRQVIVIMPIPTPHMRLGNLMFEYASTLGIAHSTKRAVMLQKQFPLVQYFRLTTAKFHDDRCVCTAVEHAYTNISAHARTFQPEVIAEVAESNSVCLKVSAYLQSFKYFNGIRRTLIREFQFSKSTRRRAKKVIRAVVSEVVKAGPRMKENGVKMTVVGIHIRRGDYLTNHSRNHGFTVPDEQYIERAIIHLESLLTNSSAESILYLIIGTAQDYNKKLVSKLMNRTVLAPPQQEPIVDLCILTLADHVIMTVGSFGWWGAYLARGITIYYNRTAVPGSLYARGYKKDDHFPREWIGID